jgi:hypothetical protein
MGVIKLTLNTRWCPHSDVRNHLVQPVVGFGGQRGLPRVFKCVRRRRPALFHLTPRDAGKFLTERTIDPTSP